MRAASRSRVGLDEDGGADAGLTDARDDGREELGVFGDVPAGARSQCARSVGHERDLFGHYFHDHADEVVGRVAFDIEFGGYDLAQFIDVAARDMPLVGAGMDGDSLGAETLAVEGEFFYVGDVFSAGVAQSGNFVYIDAKACHNLWLLGL